MEIASIIIVIALLIFSGKSLAKLFGNTNTVLDFTGEVLETATEVGTDKLNLFKVEAKVESIKSAKLLNEELNSLGITDKDILSKDIMSIISEGIATAPSNTNTSNTTPTSGFVPQT